MIKYCPFDERFRCGIWIDNEVMRLNRKKVPNYSVQIGTRYAICLTDVRAQLI